MPKRNVILLVAICLSCLAAYAARERAAPGRRFGEVLSLVRSSYLERVDEEQLFDSAVDAALENLDEHSTYLRGEGRADLEATLDQRFGGVGLELAIDDRLRVPVVASPVVDSPAWRAGLRVGDRVESVDGVSTAGMPLRQIVSRLRGPVGEQVLIQIATPADSPATLDPSTSAGDAPLHRREVTLTREVITTQSALGDRRRPDGRWEWMIEGEPGVGYLRITSFGEHTAAEAAAAVDAIAAAGSVRGLVLDLRGNPGGLLASAVEICDLFLDDGVIVQTRGRRVQGAGAPQALEARRATPGIKLAGVPMVVLVDGLSASAAEIVAAGLQDAGRATVVGSRTFGKGTVQSILPLSDDRGLLKLTTSEYLRPNGGRIDRRAGVGDDTTWGVVPDSGYEVSLTAEATARVAAWRRSRDAAGPVSAAFVARGLPRDVDSVLARALDAIPEANQPDLTSEKETSRHDHDAAPAGT